MSAKAAVGGLHLRLPATSANLGPGFDALGLAMSLYLTIDAVESPDATFAIEATGRDRELCGTLENNLILDTYIDVVRKAGNVPTPLYLTLHNEIPLGMGCGSSAAALLAGVLLANHFGNSGGLGWSGYEVMEEACRREGHPDNVAACWLGGMTASAVEQRRDRERIITASCGRELIWGLMLAVPSVGLATEKARALLPTTYSRLDAVTNVQHTALLVAAFALGRSDLLRTAMKDCLHQPYRSEACPLLSALLPIADRDGVFGVALSGAGPSVLMIFERENAPDVRAAVQEMAGDIELIELSVSKGTTVLVT